MVLGKNAQSGIKNFLSDSFGIGQLGNHKLSQEKSQLRNPQGLKALHLALQSYDSSSSTGNGLLKARGVGCGFLVNRRCRRRRPRRPPRPAQRGQSVPIPTTRSNPALHERWTKGQARQCQHQQQQQQRQHLRQRQAKQRQKQLRWKIEMPRGCLPNSKTELRVSKSGWRNRLPWKADKGL